MITHGTKTSKVFSTGKNPKIEVIRGYYLVLPNKDRHWMGETKHSAAMVLDKMCNKYLTADTGWEYWVDWCLGYDVHGNLAWANMDQSDSIEAAGEHLGW